MIDPSTLDGQRVAILLIRTDDQGKDEIAAFTGLATYDAGQLVLDRGPSCEPFAVPEHAVSRAKPVPASQAEELEHAAFYILLTLSPLPPGERLEDYEDTGLIWPRTPDSVE